MDSIMGTDMDINRGKMGFVFINVFFFSIVITPLTLLGDFQWQDSLPAVGCFCDRFPYAAVCSSRRVFMFP